MTIKHILSLPTLHCYARLTLASYPLQIVSVELAQPASWKDDPERSRLVEDIRRTNQDLCLTAAEVDELHSEHLDQFLDVEAFARELKRDARAAHKKRQDDREAEEREQDGKAAQILATQLIAGTKQPTSPLNPTVSAESTGNDQSTEENEEGDAKDGNKTARNHRRRTRSRRMGTKHENMQSLVLPIDFDADGNEHALPGFGGPIAAGGNSWGGISGYEGREGRERG